MSGTIASSPQLDRWGGLRSWLYRWFGRPEGPSSQAEQGPDPAGGGASCRCSSLIPTAHVASNLEHAVRLRPSVCPDPRAQMMSLLVRGEGASVAEIAEATGWQAHSVRAALSGLRKRGVVIERMGRDGRACRYRVIPAAGDDSSPLPRRPQRSPTGDVTSSPGAISWSAAPPDSTSSSPGAASDHAAPAVSGCLPSGATSSPPGASSDPTTEPCAGVAFAAPSPEEDTDTPANTAAAASPTTLSAPEGSA